MTRRGLILFVLLGVAWGIPYLLIKIAVGELTPAMLVFARTALAAVVLLPVAAVRGELRPVLRRWRPLIGYTLAEIIVPQFLLGSAEQELPGIGVTALGLTITALVYAPVVSLTHGWPSAWPSPSVLTSVVVLALVCSAAALTIMVALVAEVGPVRATAVTYLNPAVALVAGAVVLGEPVTGWSLAGFALILAGCCLVAVRRRTSGCDPAAEFGRPVVSG
jgi:drug/metabolite transporter (DMT)-like permease